MADTSGGASRLPLSALLSQALVAFIIEFDNEFERQMPHRTSSHGRTVGQRTGPWLVSMAMWSEAISMAMGILAKRGLAVSGPAPDGGRWQVARLTPKGRNAQNKCRERLGDVEDRWQERFGGKALSDLRRALERLASGAGRARLDAGLEPPPGGWRASVRRPGTLPQYPMVLHRGGFPDGS